MVAYEAIQIPITAGHEFIVTTDVKYKDICDDKYMYVDYVSGLHTTLPFFAEERFHCFTG
jgi:pyruvate kinase